jgi:Glycosyl transferase family 11
MITHDVYGGLGNQLFQIFTTIAISLKSGYSFFFLYKPAITDQDTHRHAYWDSFLKNLDPFVVHADASNSFLSWKRIHVSEPANNEFFEIVPYHVMSLNVMREFGEDVVEVVYQLVGFFQSYKYFEHEFDDICRMIGLETQKQAIIQEIHDNGYIIAPISMHFRLGDYKHLQHIHPIMPFEYYRNSLTFVLDKLYKEYDYPGPESNPIPVLLFCEASDLPEIHREVICRLEPLFPMCEFICAPFGHIEWKQMLYMSLCRCNIIANSTFSLWAAFFNTNPDAIICYPWHWYTDLFKKSVKDMFPAHWNRIGYIACDNTGEKSKHRV